MGPHPAVAEVRRAVRTALAGVEMRVLVACSGGADSLALRRGDDLRGSRRARPVGRPRHRRSTRCRPGSLERGAGGRVDQASSSATTQSEVVRVVVGTAGGPEAAARAARYAALDAAGEAFGASLLLGHTLDDQAETVLLGLGRGSGPRRRGRDATGRRALPPTLPASPPVDDGGGLRVALGLTPWHDPANSDARFQRSAAAHRGAAAPRSRSCKAGWRTPWPVPRPLTQSDLDAPSTRSPSHTCPPRAAELDATSLAAHLPGDPLPGVRGAGRRAAECQRSPRPISAELDALVARWHGQARVDLPGGFGVTRVSGRLCLISPHSHKG